MRFTNGLTVHRAAIDGRRRIVLTLSTGRQIIGGPGDEVVDVLVATDDLDLTAAEEREVSDAARAVFDDFLMRMGAAGARLG